MPNEERKSKIEKEMKFNLVPLIKEKVTTYRFVPKHDITAYELAQIMVEFRLCARQDFYKNAPYNIQRHFKAFEE